ncbi:hypothetical protein GGX14DRAFT_626904 [Mycena pura]|uniref:Uncharacterized protein n=1 Tax=Mycena pura TaxID=153505 RepID=A0AAD6YQT5_9AGAR|nr:hypothetical protein GGX14DRAFT_626904 [Mycena pura]
MSPFFLDHKPSVDPADPTKYTIVEQLKIPLGETRSQPRSRSPGCDDFIFLLPRSSAPGRRHPQAPRAFPSPATNSSPRECLRHLVLDAARVPKSAYAHLPPDAAHCGPPFNAPTALPLPTAKRTHPRRTVTTRLVQHALRASGRYLERRPGTGLGSSREAEQSRTANPVAYSIGRALARWKMAQAGWTCLACDVPRAGDAGSSMACGARS